MHNLKLYLLILRNLRHAQEQTCQRGNHVGFHIVNFKRPYFVYRQVYPIEPSSVLLVYFRRSRRFGHALLHVQRPAHAHPVLAGIYHALWTDPGLRFKHPQEVAQKRLKKVSKLVYRRSRLQEIEHVESNCVLAYVVKSGNLNPVLRQLLHQRGFNNVVGLVHFNSRVVEHFPVPHALTHNHARASPGLQFRRQFAHQPPFPNELRFFRVRFFQIFRINVVVIRQQVLVYRPYL